MDLVLLDDYRQTPNYTHAGEDGKIIPHYNYSYHKQLPRKKTPTTSEAEEVRLASYRKKLERKLARNGGKVNYEKGETTADERNKAITTTDDYW